MSLTLPARSLAGLVAAALLLVAAPAQALPTGPAAEAADEVRLVVRHRAGAADAVAGLARQLGADPVAAVPEIATQTVAVDAEDASEVGAALERDPRIEEVHRDVPVAALEAVRQDAPVAGLDWGTRTPDDLHWREQWGMAQVSAPAAWGRSTGSDDVVIAVLDTGVSADHPDLRRNVLAPGYDAITRKSVAVPADVQGHGTHVAGIAAAVGDNGIGVAGMCWSCRILPVKVLDDRGAGMFSDLEAGIVWAADNDADVIVMSLGTGATTTTAPSDAAVRYAAGKGVLLVAAAGNAGTAAPVWPAAFPEVVGVASTDGGDQRVPSSSHGSWVDVAAPGASILSTVPGGGYAWKGGTSMAAPHVAGALALARSSAPDQGGDRLRAALLATADPVGSFVASGRLDVAGLLAAVEPAAERPGAPAAVAAVAGDASARVTWGAAAANGAPITSYVVRTEPGGGTMTVAGGSTAVTFDGLPNGVARTFTVTAVNRVGTGPASAPSAPVTPRASLPWSFDGNPASTERVTEAHPVGAAAAISLRRFAAADGSTDGPRAQHAVLSRDDTFPDSLAGAPLTATGPLLFTGTRAMPAATAGELRRILPPGGTVYLLGGEAAISAGVAEQVRALGLQPVRLAGAARVETSLRIADEVRRLYPGDRTLLVARAYGSPGNETSGWADSVTGGAYGAAARVPVVLTPTGSLHPAVAAWARRDAPARSVLLGGAAALSDAVAAGLPRSQRVSGGERTATAAAVATQLWGVTATGQRRFVVVNGFDPLGWAHGLVAAGVAADARAPLLLVTPGVTEATKRLVASCGTAQVDLLLLGGTAALPVATADELTRVDGAGC